LDRLAVDAGDAGIGVAARRPAHPPPQGGEEPIPGTILLPGLEVVVDGLPGREVIGQGPPRTALAGEVEDGIDHLAHVGFARPAAGSGRRNPRLQDGPLLVRQIRRVAFAVHTELYAKRPFWNRLSTAVATSAAPKIINTLRCTCLSPGHQQK